VHRLLTFRPIEGAIAEQWKPSFETRRKRLGRE
jgi:hypothetical protein